MVRLFPGTGKFSRLVIRACWFSVSSNPLEGAIFDALTFCQLGLSPTHSQEAEEG